MRCRAAHRVGDAAGEGRPLLADHLRRRLAHLRRVTPRRPTPPCASRCATAMWSRMRRRVGALRHWLSPRRRRPSTPSAPAAASTTRPRCSAPISTASWCATIAPKSLTCWALQASESQIIRTAPGPSWSSECPGLDLRTAAMRTRRARTGDGPRSLVASLPDSSTPCGRCRTPNASRTSGQRLRRRVPLPAGPVDRRHQLAGRAGCRPRRRSARSAAATARCIGCRHPAMPLVVLYVYPTGQPLLHEGRCGNSAL